jgi:outer membrane protein assembly factor BamB
MRLLILSSCLALVGCVPDKEPKPVAKVPEAPRTLVARVSGPAGTRAGSDWPGFLGPNANSTSAEKGILAPWPENGLSLVWARPLGEGYGAPAIQKGRLYVFDRIRAKDRPSRPFPPRQDDDQHQDSARLTCVESTTGKEVWKFEYPTDYEDKYNYSNGPRCCPVVDDDRVYIYGAEGMLHCLRTESGKVVWKIDTKKQYGIVQNFFGVGSAPMVEKDLLIVQVGGSPKGSDEVPFDKVKGNGTAVVALDKRTGKERWRCSDELASYSVPRVVTIGKRRWCFVFTRGGLVALDPATGKQDFHFPWRARVFESVNASTPVIVDNRVFLSETYGPGSVLLKVKPGGYDVVWSDKEERDKSMQCHWNTPIYHDGYLYGCTGRHDSNAKVRCIELATGKIAWTWEDPERTERTSLMMVDGHFLCLGEFSDLRLLKINPKKYEEVSRMLIRPDNEDGKREVWGRRVARSPFWAAPILSHGLVYVRGGSYLFCYELIREKK